jgi:NADH-quinone oxidoreductase subunit N
MQLTGDRLSQIQDLLERGMLGFVPEIILSLAVIALLLCDLGRRRIRPAVPGWIAGLALGLAALWIVVNFPTGTSPLFGWLEGSVHKPLLVNDPFAAFFKLFVLATSLIVLPMCMQSPLLNKRSTSEFYALLVAASLGMLIMASSANLLMIYLGIEFASMASYLAVGYFKQDRRSSEAGLKYVIYGSVASGIMIFGLSLVYGLTGSLALDDLASTVTASGMNATALAVASILVFAGFAYKMAAFPMHFWCPDVYEGAPLPFTAYLSVASKAAGFAVCIRFLMAFGPEFRIRFTDYAGLPDGAGFGWKEIIAAASALSMTAGNLAALKQENIRRMLAYSSIAHAGYLLMGVAVLKPEGAGSEQFGALLFYFIVYFLMNLGAFFVVHLVTVRTGEETIESYKGLGRRAPFLAVALTTCLVSLLGIPPTGGFIGKLHLLSEVVEGGLIWLAVVAGINTAISAYFYFKLIKAIHLDKAKDESFPAVAISNRLLVAALVAPLLILGIFFAPVSEWTKGFGL